MSSQYPGALDQLTNPTSGTAQNDSAIPHTKQHADANDAIEAVQGVLGTNPQGEDATVAARLDRIEEDIAGGGNNGGDSELRADFDSLRATVEGLRTAIAELQAGTPQATKIVRIGYCAATILPAATTPTDPEPPTSTGAIEVGKLRLGANHGSITSSGQYTGYRIEQYDSRIHGPKVTPFNRSTTGPQSTGDPTRLMGTVREYFDTMKWTAGQRSLVEGWIRQGRVPMLSNNNDGWTLDEIIAGRADADLLDQANWFKTLPGIAAAAGNGGTGQTMYSPLRHEPENEFTTADAQAKYRAAARYIAKFMRAAGVTKAMALFMAPLYVTPMAFQGDFRKHYMEWDGTGGREWVLNSDGSRWEGYDLLGIDAYQPHVNSPGNPTRPNPIDGIGQDGPDTEFNKSFARDQKTIIDAYFERGGRNMPMVIGEYGLYSSYHQGGYARSLVLEGTDVGLILSDLVDDGVTRARLPIVAVCFWNSNLCRLDDERDLKETDTSKGWYNADNEWGDRTYAIRQISRGKVLRTTTGARVTPETPWANRRWVDNPSGGNRVVSLGA